MNKPTLEELIISCLLQKPELFNTLKLADTDFARHKTAFLFLKNFYAQYKTLDITFMGAVIADKYRLVSNLEPFLDLAFPSLFDHYQEAFIKERDEEVITKARIEKVYSLSTQLIMRAITIEQFQEEVAKI